MQEQTIPARTLGDLLNETFIVYGKSFWRLVGLVAMVQVPASLLTLIPVNGAATYILVGIAGLFASAIIYAAASIAVGHHYVAGEVKISRCYYRALTRGTAVATLTAVFALVLAPIILVTFLVFWLLSAPLAVAMAVAVAVPLFAHWVLAVEATMFEGHKTYGALVRSIEMVNGRWGRVYGITLVYLLVTIGLAILLTVPMAVGASVVAPEGASIPGTLIPYVGSTIMMVFMPAVLIIAGTLLYFDLRVRGEDYDLATLSRELGLASVN